MGLCPFVSECRSSVTNTELSLLFPEGRPVDSLSSMSAQCSPDTDPGADTMADNGNGKEDSNIKTASDSAAHAHHRNENGEKKLLRMEENQEASALGKKGIDEAEKATPEALTAREDTRIFHENIMAMQHDSPEVNGGLKQTELGESNTNEEQKCPPVPWESRALKVEDGSEESPWCEEGAGEYSPPAWPCIPALLLLPLCSSMVQLGGWLELL